jgi:hypothetical protein
LELYDFPIKVDDQWEISSNIFSSGSFIIEGLIEEEFSGSETFDETLQCTNMESVSVPAGDFECYKIISSLDSVWYSPEVGNIVKSEVDQGDRDYTFNMDLSLESFSTVNQPINVTEKIDPPEAIISQEINISGRATDSNGNPIKDAEIYIEIPSVGENWVTSTDNDGYYTITIEAPSIVDDTPSEGEFGSDGVIVHCSSSDLEGYRVKTLLIIDYLPPNPPVIDGKTRGKPGIEYEYSFISNNPDNYDIYYFVEWGDSTNSGWKGPYPGDDPMILSHTWYEEGTYTIRAKAKDDYGIESDWGYLDVTMPKNKIKYNTLFLRLIDRYPNAFPILRYILNLKF